MAPMNNCCISNFSNLTMNDDKKAAYTFNAPRFQNFSIPSNIIYYIIVHYFNHIKVHRKLIQTCKYIFFKKPIIHIHDFGCLPQNKKLIRQFLLPTKTKIFWFTGKFFPNAQFRYPISKIIQKICRCDIRILNLSIQSISLNEFIFLTSSLTLISVEFFKFEVKNGDNEKVSVLSLSETYLPNIQKFTYSFNHSESAASLISLPNLRNLSHFKLNYLPYGLNIEVLKEFIQTHPKTDIIINFHALPYNNNNIHLFYGYRIQLQELVDNILDGGVTERCPPLIDFYGQNNENFYALIALRKAYFQKYPL